jgi:hypothetical protein
MTAPEARPGGLDTNVRGLMVLLVALVVGFVLLASWPSDDDSSSGASTNTTIDTSDLDDSTTTTAEAAATTTTAANTSDKAPSEVSVIVLNGSGKTGAAAAASTTIGNSGFNMLQPADAPARIPTTTVFYAEGFQADAEAIAAIVGKGADAVKPIAEANLGAAAGDADVAVVLGEDTAPVGTTTTVAGSGATTTTTP